MKNETRGGMSFQGAKMSRGPDGPCSPTAFTIWEVAVVVLVIFCTLSIVLPHFGGVREAARRMSCTNNLKQIGLAIHVYEQANNMIPPGTISAGKPTAPGNQYDILAEAAETGPGFQGTSFLLGIMPFIEGDPIAKDWQYDQGISSSAANEHGMSNLKIARMDVEGFYCPTRRHGLRKEDSVMMLAPSWTGGGTDYGGCAGRHAAFTNQTGYNLCDATMRYEPEFQPQDKQGNPVDNAPEKRWGILGRVNVGTRLDEIADGTSNTIMTGELQRITDVTPCSKDGWAIGGPCTLFTTGAYVALDGKTTKNVAPPEAGKLLNNKFWGSPGSAHPSGANFGLGDGSVRFISNSIDSRVFALLGSMADGVPLGDDMP